MEKDIKKPSEKMAEDNFDGMEVIDETGRIFSLRTPDILDEYDLMSALGEDAANDSCRGMASAMLFVGKIDGLIFESPKSYAEIRAGIKRIGRYGFKALTDFIQEKNKSSSTNKEEVINKIKK